MPLVLPAARKFARDQHREKQAMLFTPDHNAIVLVKGFREHGVQMNQSWKFIADPRVLSARFPQRDFQVHSFHELRHAGWFHEAALRCVADDFEQAHPVLVACRQSQVAADGREPAAVGGPSKIEVNGHCVREGEKATFSRSRKSANAERVSSAPCAVSRRVGGSMNSSGSGVCQAGDVMWHCSCR